MPVAERDYMRDGWRWPRRRSQLQRLALLIVAVAVAVLAIRFLAATPRAPTRKPAPVRFTAEPRLVDVNSATLAELDALPYVSEKVAVAIVQGRPYARAEDLLRVRGIGPKTLERIRPHIRLGGAEPSQATAAGD